MKMRNNTTGNDTSMERLLAVAIILICSMFFGGVIFGAFIASFHTANIYQIILGMGFGGAMGLVISWNLIG